MKTTPALAALLSWAALALLPAPAAGRTATEELRALADEMVEREYDLFPVAETFSQAAGPRAGRAVYNLAPDWRSRARNLYRDVARRAGAIRASDLEGTDRITHEMLVLHARQELAELEHPVREMRLLTPQQGMASALIYLSSGIQPFRTTADFEAWLERLDATSANYDEAIDVLRAAARRGWTTPRALVERTLPQLESIATLPVENGPLWRVLAKYPRDAGDEARARFEQRYRQMLEERHVPALKRLIAFARDEYLPMARTTAGIGDLPRGEDAYRVLVRSHTTLPLMPDEIHALGLREVARIAPRMLEVARGLGFKGEMKDLSAWLESNPGNYPFHGTQEVLDYAAAVNVRVTPELPKLFRELPRASLEVRLADPTVAATASVSYSRPPPDLSRPGYVTLPVPDPRKVAAHTLTALMLHEGMPGHHLELARRIDRDQSRFRINARVTAYSEGWGLYAESLGHELGVYDDPWALLGRYALELHRAARLVVDTGMHRKGWSRERAIRYLVEQRGQSEQGATVAIERYMATPGQALAYKIGELEILRLREEARRKLGKRFDIREFHEVILGEGPLPLSILGKRVRAWIATQRR